MRISGAGVEAHWHMGMHSDYGANFEVAQSIHPSSKFISTPEFSGACIRMDRVLGF